jgi:hypothetical protein
MFSSERNKIVFQSSETMIKIISKKTRIKTREIPITNGKTFYKQFQYKDNTGNAFPYIIYPRMYYISNLAEEAMYHGDSIPLVHIEAAKPCECGSTVNSYDETRDELFCPTCGLVEDQIYTNNPWNIKKNKGIIPDQNM